MSLYGLDVIITKDGGRFLNEINGILSGMNGFRQVYGDDRVEERVFDMLQNEYGTLTINDGTYRRNQFRKEHPLKFAMGYVLLRTPLIKRFFFLLNSTLSSKKAETDWLTDRIASPKPIELPFDSYDGQESTVINAWNEELPHSTVNPVVAESISRNKFLQYLLLDNSEISETIPKSSLVGLGATNEDELGEMVSNYDHFVVKPILGSCGRGIRFLTKDEVDKKYIHSRGPLDYIGPLESLLAMDGKSPRIKYIEDLIEQGDFSFEPGVSIIQPFIDSKQVDEGRETYSVVRAIVCNGKFVDAYQRTNSNPRVNLSQGAIAASFNYDDDFVGFCEKAIEVFEGRAKEYSPDSYKKILYQRYIDERGRTSDIQRDLDRTSPLMDVIFFTIKQEGF